MKSPSIEEIFQNAVKLPTAPERAAYLRGVCGPDEELRQKVEALLEAHDEAVEFMATDPAEPDITIPDRDLAEGPGATIGRYKLLQKVGEGGMGVVYMAEQTEPVTRKVALKIIKLGMDTKQVVARFEAERQALAMMDHPNIARVLDAGSTETGRPYFVMELVRGVPITEYCDKNRLNTSERLQLFMPVCQAIQHAHQKGVIHRDIKPSNVMVTLHDGSPVPKVIDFGIAKATNQKLTEKTLFTNYAHMIGTPAYMSPEQAEMSGLDVDTRTDVYSLGVLLYELMTGTTPFPSKELMSMGYGEIQRVIAENEPPKPSTRLSTMQNEHRTVVASNRSMEASALGNVFVGDLDWIVMKALEKDRTHRYETVNGLVADIRRHLNDEPVTAAAPTFSYQLSKFARRNQRYARAAAVVAGLLVVATLFSLFQASKAKEAEEKARDLLQSVEEARLQEEGQKRIAQQKQQEAEESEAFAKESAETARRFLYASEINLAQQAVRMNNYGRAKRLLDKQRPVPGQEDLRGWEWRYLWKATRGNEHVNLARRENRGWSVSVSASGDTFAIGWGDGRIDLWDVKDPRTPSLSRTILNKRMDGPWVCFSPKQNVMAACVDNHAVALFDLDSGEDRVIWKATGTDERYISDLSFSPDGSRVVILGGRIRNEHALGRVWIVEVGSGTILDSMGTESFIDSWHCDRARLAPDNTHLFFSHASSSQRHDRKNEVRCVNTETGKMVWTTSLGSDVGVTSMAVSSDGRFLATALGYRGRLVQVWNPKTGQLLANLEGHTGFVCDLEFTQGNDRLISAGTDQTIRIWDVESWQETGLLRGHSDEIHGVAYSETKNLIASGSKDGELKLWPNVLGPRSQLGAGSLSNLTRDPIPLGEGKLLTLTEGKTPNVANLRGVSCPAPLLKDISAEQVWDLRPWVGTIGIWDGHDRMQFYRWSGGRFKDVGELKVNPDQLPNQASQRFVHSPKSLKVAWVEGEASTNVLVEELGKPSSRREFRVGDLKFVSAWLDQSGLRLSTVGVDVGGRRFLNVWNVDDGRLLKSIEGRFNSTVIGDQGRVLVTSSNHLQNYEITFYDLDADAREPKRFEQRHRLVELAVSHDESTVAVSTIGGRVHLYDAANWELVDVLDANMFAARGLAFSQDDSRLIVTSGYPETVKVWDMSTRQELLTFPGSGGSVHTAYWNLDESGIIAGFPWQTWAAPSWETIQKAEAGDR